ncbi:hypothetical protein [Microbacterium caowuchunii]|uniref:ATP synthase protein I n=1 Tax=Microbacterium caowuchunii TaxID=2614638 RepID=A0A5N0T589_9MICO|nr:hypothetical protein [Microbacterium caowuchunii]KAA9130032.1 hypothetical protein F6B40_15215 [Microbacterium caowuchunii]
MTKPIVSSTPILRATLLWGGVVGVAAILVAGVASYLAAGVPGALSGVIGALVGIVFPALTAVSILVGNRWYGTPRYLEVFFAVVLGGWVVKFILVIVALIFLSRVEWIVDLAFYFSLVGAAVASLVVDLIVLGRLRLPSVSDISMPEARIEQDGTPDGAGERGGPRV